MLLHTKLPPKRDQLTLRQVMAITGHRDITSLRRAIAAGKLKGWMENADEPGRSRYVTIRTYVDQYLEEVDDPAQRFRWPRGRTRADRLGKPQIGGVPKKIRTA